MESTGGDGEENVSFRLQRGEAGSQQGNQQQTREQQQPRSPEEAPGKGGEVSAGGAEGKTPITAVERYITKSCFNFHLIVHSCLPD